MVNRSEISPWFEQTELKFSFYVSELKIIMYLIGEKKPGEKWPNFVLGDQILTGSKF